MKEIRRKIRKPLTCLIMAALIFAGILPVLDMSHAATNPVFVPNPPKVNKSYRGVNATRVPVLTYHMMASDKEKKMRANKNNSLVISQSRFNQQMKYLHDNGYRTISMEEFYLWYKGRIRLPKKSVLITFDDGKYSVVKYGLPILKKYNMRATIFMIGIKTKNTTYTRPVKNGRYGFIGLDVMRQTSKTYPNFEYQSHTWNMHHFVGRSTAVNRLSYRVQNGDMKVQYNKFRYTFLAYPYGAYTKTTMRTAHANHIKLAFTYGKNAYAKKSDYIYAVRRIKVPGNMSIGNFRRWVKPR